MDIVSKILNIHYHNKFFAAVTAGDIAGPCIALKKTAQGAEHGVAGGVSVGIVEKLKVVYIEHDYADRYAGAPGFEHLEAESFFKEAPVEKVRQRVASRLVTKFLS